MGYRIVIITLICLLLNGCSKHKKEIINKCEQCFNNLYENNYESFYKCLSDNSKYELSYLYGLNNEYEKNSFNYDGYLLTENKRYEDERSLSFQISNLRMNTANLRFFTQDSLFLEIDLIKENGNWNLDISEIQFVQLLRLSKKTSDYLFKQLIRNSFYDLIPYFYHELDNLTLQEKKNLISLSKIDPTTDSSYIYFLIKTDCFTPFNTYSTNENFVNHRYVDDMENNIKLASLGMPSAMIEIGKRLVNDKVKKIDHDYCLLNTDYQYWYKLAGKQGNSDGYYKLGDLYKYGNQQLPLMQNLDSATYYYRKAVELKSNIAAFDLAILYLYEPKYYKPDEAFNLLKQSVGWDYDCAACMLGTMYLLHYENLDSAKYWYEYGLNSENNCSSNKIKDDCILGLKRVKNWNK